ncbi:MAG: rhomboid family intramembrane serine protease [Enterococcus sp.]
MNYQQQMQMKRWLNRPIVTYSFLAIQSAVFIFGFLVPGSLMESSGMMFGPAIAVYHQYWRFVTPIFIHLSLAHFAINSVVLYFLGQQVEAIYGHGRFLILYLLSGIMGNVVSFAFNEAGVSSAGSSTAIFGIFGAFLILGMHFKRNPGIQAMVRQFSLFVGFSLVFGIFDRTIDMWGHIGGLLGGLLLGNILALPNNHGKFNLHTRVISGMIFVFLLIISIVYGLNKYDFLL